MRRNPRKAPIEVFLESAGSCNPITVCCAIGVAATDPFHGSASRFYGTRSQPTWLANVLPHDQGVAVIETLKAPTFAPTPNFDV
jgi:hypothetical protein